MFEQKKDYYATLGVSASATEAEIKKAYRKLARQLHPDINPSQEAQERFKQITEAYDTLADPKRRAHYDAGGDTAGFGIGDIFDVFFGGNPGTNADPFISVRSRGMDLKTRINVTLYESVFGVTKALDIDTYATCKNCQGSAAEPGSSVDTCSACAGSGTTERKMRSPFGIVMSRSVCDVCAGVGTQVQNPCRVCAATGRVRDRVKVDVAVPPGVKTGIRLKLAGRGEAGTLGEESGDLYVQINVLEHESIISKGDDLYCMLNVSFLDAALGSDLVFESFDGPVSLRIPKGASSGTRLKVPARGAVGIRNQKRGNLFVYLNIRTPDLTKKHISALRALAEEIPKEAATLEPGLGLLQDFRYGED